MLFQRKDRETIQKISKPEIQECIKISEDTGMSGNISE